jgi:hypothetical protein
VVDLQTQRSDVARQATKLEQDIDQVRARSQRDQQRLDSGAISSAKELESLQHEIASLRRRQTELEDVELDILQRVEDLDGGLSKLSSRQVVLRDRRSLAERERDDQLAEIDRESTELAEQRMPLVASLPDGLVVFYEKLREQLGGVAVAELRQRRCEGCRLELNATEVGRFRGAAEDTVLRCEECRRIVVRTDESGL